LEGIAADAKLDFGTVWLTFMGADRWPCEMMQADNQVGFIRAQAREHAGNSRAGFDGSRDYASEPSQGAPAILVKSFSA